MRKILISSGLEFLLILLLIGMYALLLSTTQIQFENGRYMVDDKETIFFKHPLVRRSDAASFTVELDVTVPFFHSNIIHIIPDDCLKELWVNDQLVQLTQQICWQGGGTVNLRNYLGTGRNHIRAIVDDHGGMARFKIRPSIEKDPLYFIPTVLLIAGLFFYGYRRLS